MNAWSLKSSAPRSRTSWSITIAIAQRVRRRARARQLRAQIRDIEREQTELVERAEAFKAGAGQETPELAQARKHLMDTEFALRDMQPRVAAAYRAAARNDRGANCCAAAARGCRPAG